MLLQRLREYQLRNVAVSDDGDEGASVPPGYEPRNVPWIVHLNASGGGATFIRTSGTDSKTDPGKRFNMPYLRRSGRNIKPQLLADTAEIALGVPDEKDPQRAANRHEDFVTLVDACAEFTGDPAMQAVGLFLRNLSSLGLNLPHEMRPKDNVAFMVEGKMPTESEAAQDFWERIAPFLSQKSLPRLLTKEMVLTWLGQAAKAETGQCLVCWENDKTIARVHPVSIKVPRSVSDRQLSIVAANKDAFWSYGLEQSYIAPMCRTCAQDYVRGANRLIRGEQSHFILAGTVFLFWTQQPVDFDFYSLMTDPQEEQVRSLYEAAFKGGPVPQVDETKFYATALSGSGSRAVVRDWLDTTVWEAKRHLAEWFRRQQVIDSYGQPMQPLGIYALAASTVRDARTELAPPTPRVLVRAAIAGTPLPPSLLQAAVRRCQVERMVIRQRAALIKLMLSFAGPYNPQEDTMTALNVDHPDPAYHLGRLFALLEAAQTRALGEVNTGLGDKYFATASTTPRLVIPHLVRLHKHHINKLRRERPAVARALENQITELVERFREVPGHFKLEEQGLFMLGYYHQQAHDRAEAASRRQSGQPTQPNSNA